MSGNSGSISTGSNPVGFRFKPTDEELINFYLTNMVFGRDDHLQDIAKIDDICNYEPWELPRFSSIESADQVWYFFSPPNYKYKNSKRTNRTTKAGYWKLTGKQLTIKARNRKDVIGKKRTLVFYQGSVRDQNGKRTSWVMHEYEITADLPNQNLFLLYKLKKKDDDDITNASNESNYNSHADDAEDANAITIQDFGGLEIDDELGLLQDGSSAHQDDINFLSTLQPPQSSTWNSNFSMFNGHSNGYNATQSALSWNISWFNNHGNGSSGMNEDQQNEFSSSFLAGAPYEDSYPRN